MFEPFLLAKLNIYGWNINITLPRGSCKRGNNGRVRSRVGQNGEIFKRIRLI